jgi:histidine ammonia-lyase
MRSPAGCLVAAPVIAFRIRSVVPHLTRDRLQGSDIESAVRLVREGALVDLVD